MKPIILIAIILGSIGTFLTIFNFFKKSNLYKFIGVLALISSTIILAIDSQRSSNRIELLTKNMVDTTIANYNLTKQIDKKIDIVVSDTILKVKYDISKEYLTSDDFISFYIQVLEKASIAENNKKRDIFSNLINQYINDHESSFFEKSNLYKTYLDIIDRLTVTDITIIMTLEKYKEKYLKNESENLVQWTSRYWEKFENELTSTLSISIDELYSLIKRIESTGCLHIYTESWNDNGIPYSRTTDLYKRIRKILNED